MNYPLDMRFRILTLAPKIQVRDASGETVCFVQQKLFRLKEAVNVFQDESQQKLLCAINADRVIDWSACYNFSDSGGEFLGAVRRKGMRSIWRAHYEILDESRQQYATIQEENPMAKVFDSFLGDVPVLGLATGYFFHPRYLCSDPSGQPLFRLTKQRALLESSYRIDKLGQADPVDELRALMSMIMMTLLERQRG